MLGARTAISSAYSDPACTTTGCVWDCASECGANPQSRAGCQLLIRSTVGFSERSPSVQGQDAWSRFARLMQETLALGRASVSRPRLVQDLQSSRHGGAPSSRTHRVWNLNAGTRRDTSTPTADRRASMSTETVTHPQRGPAAARGTDARTRIRPYLRRAEAIDRLERLRSVVPVFAQEVVSARRQAAWLRAENSWLTEQVRQLQRVRAQSSPSVSLPVSRRGR
jgi:hypothetical protein